MILEYSIENVDIMHLEGAVFQAFHKANGVTSVSFTEEYVQINGYDIPITEEKGVYSIDFSNIPNEKQVVDSMANVWEDGRMFPNVYPEEIQLDDIDPKNVDRFVPSTVEEFYDIYNEWIVEAIEKTLELHIETGFMQDSLDNILGVLEGKEGSITWPKSLVSRHGMRFHTHPEVTFMADPSISDLEILYSTKGEVGADAIASTFGTEEIVMLSYTVKIRDDNAVPEEEVEKYIQTMKDMAREELKVGKHLAKKDIISLDPYDFDKGDIDSMVEKRIDMKSKRDMIRQIASEGYRIEPSWGVIE